MQLITASCSYTAIDIAELALRPRLTPPPLGGAARAPPGGGGGAQPAAQRTPPRVFWRGPDRRHARSPRPRLAARRFSSPCRVIAGLPRGVLTAPAPADRQTSASAETAAFFAPRRICELEGPISPIGSDSWRGAESEHRHESRRQRQRRRMVGHACFECTSLI